MKKKYLMLTATVAALVACGGGWTIAPQLGLVIGLLLNQGVVVALVVFLAAQLLAAVLDLPEFESTLLAF